MYELSAELNGVAFTGNKIIVEDIILPHNLDDLKSLYDLMSNGSKSYPNTKVVKKDIEKNGFIGQKVTLTDSIGNRLYESEVYLLDNHLFLFNCISKDNSDIKNSDYFFNQISLPKDSGIKQLTGKSELIKMLSQFKTEILIFIGIIGLIIGIILIKNYLQQRV
jgi:hypothetical protein